MLALALVAGCKQRSEYYRKMEIDSKALTVRLLEPFPGLYFGASGAFYFKFTSAYGRYTIDHFEKADKSAKSVRYNAFFVDPQDRLITRSKYHELLHGSFGTVFARTTYFYADEYGEKWTDFETAPYMNDVGSEPPQVMVEPPGGLPRTLSAVSVVRVVRAAPEFLIACANYAPDGHLESLSVHGARGSDWIHTNHLGSAARGFQAGRSIGDRPETREQFGLPREFPVTSYQLKRESPFASTRYPRVLDAVNFHYERDRWVEQDIFPAEGLPSRRYLAFKVTPEDQALEPVDRQRLFGQFPYTREGISR